MFDPLFEKRNQKILKEFLQYSSSLQQIGDKYGITRERVRQIVAKSGYNRTTSNFLAENFVNWDNIVKIARALRLTNKSIASGIGRNYESVKHVFYGDPRYRAGKTAERVLLFVLKKATEVTRELNNLADKIV